MEDKRLREKLHSKTAEELKFTKADRAEVFEKIHQPEENPIHKKHSMPILKTFVPIAVSLLMVGLCIVLFFPSLLSSDSTKEAIVSVAGDPGVEEQAFSTTLITVKSEDMDNRIYLNLLLTYHEEEQKLKFISLPHDTRVPIKPGSIDPDKLLLTYQRGGAENVVSTVSELVGLPIDRYAIIDLETVSQLIELVGGVEYVLPEDIRVRGITAQAIEFEGGKQNLDGEELVALMMAATEGSDLAEETVLDLLEIVMSQTEDQVTQVQLNDLFAQMETNASAESLLENLKGIDSVEMVSLRVGMIPHAEAMGDTQMLYTILFEEEFMAAVLKELTDGERVQEKEITQEDEDTEIEETVETENEDAEESVSVLSAYSNGQIEYARIWLQLGANQEIDGLYVTKIPAGTPLNPDDDTSGVYPEDVIQLAGARLADGSVTYSSNGDGTINVYNVSLRWDGEYPAGEAFYQDLIDSTELVAVDVGEDEDVIRLIGLLKMQ